MDKVLISGITGFVGTNLKVYLRSAYETVGLSRSSENIQTLSYNKLTVDDINSAEAFIHLAGKAHDLKKISSENSYFEANTELTKMLFDLFLKSNCKTFVFMSSVKAVADTVEGVLDEQIKPNPQTVYGKSKLMAEEYIQSLKIPKGKYVYILRPCMIHGPDNKGNLNLLYNIIKKGIPYPLGKYENKRSFLSVDNLSFCIQSLIENKPASGIYNIADDTAISTNKLVAIIAESLGKKPRIVKTPKSFIKFIVKIGDVLPLPINTERLDKLTENYCVSNKKIKEALNINLPLTSIDGFKKTLKTFKINS